MTTAEKITSLASMTEETNEGVLSTYLMLAKEAIMQYAFPVSERPEEMPSQYDALQLEIAAYKLNKRGAEGETSHSENGVSRSYENADIPRALLRRIVPYAGVVG